MVHGEHAAAVGSGPRRTEVVRRSREARRRASRAIGRSQRLHTEAASLARSAHSIRLASRPRSRHAWITASLEGSPTHAVVRADGSVVAEPGLRRRLELLVALGDTLATGGPAVVGRDPLSSTLAVVRACDAVESVTWFDGRRPPAGRDG